MKIIIFFLIGFILISCTYERETTRIECTYNYNDDEIKMLTVLNEYRSSIGLNKLVLNDCVSIKTYEHNQYMIETKDISHAGFKERSDEIIKEIGVTHVNENIAYNFNTPESILTAWLNSPKHRTNIEGDFDRVGFSISESDGKKYCTMIFVK